MIEHSFGASPSTPATLGARCEVPYVAAVSGSHVDECGACGGRSALWPELGAGAGERDRGAAVWQAGERSRDQLGRVQRQRRTLEAHPAQSARARAPVPRVVDDEQHKRERVLQTDVLELKRRGLCDRRAAGLQRALKAHVTAIPATSRPNVRTRSVDGARAFRVSRGRASAVTTPYIYLAWGPRPGFTHHTDRSATILLAFRRCARSGWSRSPLLAQACSSAPTCRGWTLNGSGAQAVGYLSAAEFASSSTGEWHSRFGSSSLFTEVAGTVGRIAIVCGAGMLVAAVLWALLPERFRIWARRLAMGLAIVAILDCLLVIAAVAENDSKDAHTVSTSLGCYFTLIASVAALIVAFILAAIDLAQSKRRRHAAIRSPVSSSDTAAIR